MASFTQITVRCPVCDKPIRLVAAARKTSDRAPIGGAAVVFIEVDQTALARHAATHLTDEEAAA